MKQIFVLFFLLTVISNSNPLSDENIKVSMKLSNAPLGLIIPSILKKTGLNYLISSKIKGIKSVSLNGIHWSKALDKVLEGENLAWIRVSNVVIVCTKLEFTYFDADFLQRMQEVSKEGSPKINLSLVKVPLSLMVSAIVRKSGKKLVVTSKLRGKVSTNFKNVPWRLALGLIIRLQNFNISESDNQLTITS
ncbi:MAG: hypothetical protein COB02_17880 [Candidatus Cloacimonadota bacterium]|nr:MAG: hypothetical protein COB02_17880 [Candidatus Cloacimonadota bacterium]